MVPPLPTWLPFALTFTNQVWGAHVPIGSNIPYWSLGYEVWYYALFGCALFVPRRWAIVGCLAIAVFLGPGIIILFPLWLAGAATYQVIEKINLTRESFGWGLYLDSTILLVVFFYWLLYSPTGVAIDGFNVPRRYAVGVLFILHLVGFRRIEHELTQPATWLRKTNPMDGRHDVFPLSLPLSAADVPGRSPTRYTLSHASPDWGNLYSAARNRWACSNH